jgi:hopanoid biosynthesis associated protein HpnK
VIFNADDFGLSPGINRGILEAFREGVLTSTTMLTNLRFFDDAAALARAHPDLPVGIHLSLLWGPPVSPPARVPTLVDRQGRFPRGLARLAARYYLGRLAPAEVREELRAQVRRFLDAGLQPTHVDTHKHVHALPGILEAVIEVASKFGIDKVRLPREAPLAGRAAPRGAVKRDLLAWLARGAPERLRRAGLRSTDHFAGVADQSCLNSAALCRILPALRPGVTEIMCHPGYADEAAAEYSRTPPRREAELAGLKDPAVRRCLEQQAIRPMHWGEL